MKIKYLLLFFSFLPFLIKAQITTYNYEGGHKKAEGNLAQGIEQGEWKFWDIEGHLVQQVTYADGEFNGPYTSFYENGKKKEDGFFKTDHIHGPFTTYYDDGKVESVVAGKVARKENSVNETDACDTYRNTYDSLAEAKEKVQSALDQGWND